MVWYYKEGETAVGPLSKADLQQLINTKKINAKTLVRSVEMDQWKPLAEIVRAKASAKPATPPPQPAEGPETAEPLQKTPASNSAAASAENAADQPKASDAAATDGSPEPPDTAVCSQCGRSFPQDQVLTYEDQVICAACKPMFVQKLKEGASLPAMLAYGGFWIRFVAKIIDGIILAIVQWAVMIPTSLLVAPAVVQSGDQFQASGFIALIGFQMILGIVLPGGYSIFFIGRFGATPGKMACRLKVVTPEGGKVSYGRAAGRFFAEIISYMILAIGYIMAAFDDEKRALHDRICSTRVIRKA